MTSKAPTPSEIRKRCREVQSTWTEKVRISRIADKRLHPEIIDPLSVMSINLKMDYSDPDSITPEPENNIN